MGKEENKGAGVPEKDKKMIRHTVQGLVRSTYSIRT